MSKRDWTVFVQDILESIQLIESYTEEMDYEAFCRDRKTVDAVIRNLEIIGEAANNIPDHIQDQHSEVDWSGITGLRNRIAHEYFGLSLAIIWQIITDDLPLLR